MFSYISNLFSASAVVTEPLVQRMEILNEFQEKECERAQSIECLLNEQQITSITQLSESMKAKTKYLLATSYPYPENAYELLYHPETGLTDIESYLDNSLWSEWCGAIGRNQTEKNIDEQKVIAILKTIPDESIKHSINMLFIYWVMNLTDDGIYIPEDMCWTNEDRDEIFRFHKAVVNGTLPLLNVD